MPRKFVFMPRDDNEIAGPLTEDQRRSYELLSREMASSITVALCIVRPKTDAHEQQVDGYSDTMEAKDALDNGDAPASTLFRSHEYGQSDRLTHYIECVHYVATCLRLTGSVITDRLH